MPISINNINCCGCTACINSCPQKCINMQIDSEGFWTPVINFAKCIHCEKCVNVCQMYNYNNECSINKALVVQNTNDLIRSKSTSGGFFNVLCKYINDKSGVIYGAILDDSLKCYHESSENVSMEKFCESKYVQSNLNLVFSKIKNDLDLDRMVCFSGTPCQIYGLKRYLGKEYENLILVDLLCHGVPSPGVFEKYKCFLETKYKSKIREFHFRSKILGYSHSMILCKFENGKEYIAGIESDPYLKLFFNDISLRKSCYECKFRNTSRVGDFTLFDAWHAGQFDSRMNDDNGTTGVLLNTTKAERIFSALTDGIIFKEVDSKEILGLDGDMTYRTILEPKSRQLFFDNYKCIDDFKLLYSTVLKIKPLDIIKREIKKLKFRR